MLGQGAAKAPAVVEPPKGPQLMSALPAGMNEAFLKTSLSVQQQLQNGKFAAAATAATRTAGRKSTRPITAQNGIKSGVKSRLDRGDG